MVGADGLQHCLGTLTEATATKNVHEECANVNRLQLTTVIITITEWFPTPHALHSEPAGSQGAFKDSAQDGEKPLMQLKPSFKTNVMFNPRLQRTISADAISPHLCSSAGLVA